MSIKWLLVVVVGLFVSQSVNAETVVIKDYPADKISKSVYVIHGPTAVPNEANQGFMNNPGIVMTNKGVVVIDPGGAIEGGEMTLRVIKKLTDQPVVAVFNTHVHADHWFGNAAFTNKYPNIPVYGHQKTIDEAKSTGEAWISTIASLTKSNRHKKEIVTANKPVKHGDVITVGDTKFEIYNYPVTHTQTDIMVSVNDGEAIFMGDNLFNGRLNQHSQGHIKKTWEGVETAVNDSNAQVIVPGHGKSGDKDMLQFALNAHKLLYASVQKQYEDDVSDFEMRPAVEPVLNDYKHWEEFESLLGKVINKAFLEIEEADF